MRPDVTPENQELPAFLTAEEATIFLNVSAAAFRALAGWYLHSTRVGDRYMYRTAELQQLLADMKMEESELRKS